MREFLNVIKSAAIFDGIGDAELESLLVCLGARTERFEKNDRILREGDSPTSVGLLLSGGALISQEDFWGNRNIRARIAPGQVFAEAFACTPGSAMDVSVIADRDCEVMWLGVQRILRTCPTACPHHSRMIRNLLNDLAAGNIRANEKLTHISRRSTREKLLSYLSAESRRQGKTEFTIPFDRQQLADYLSVERSAMSSVLSQMRRDGLLSFEGSTFTLHGLE